MCLNLIFIIYSCSFESLQVVASNFNLSYCGKQNAIFLAESCSNLIEINLNTKKKDLLNEKRGVAIYYEEIARPADLDCQESSTLTTLETSLQSTTKMTTLTTTTRPSYSGFSSDIISLISCGNATFTCPSNYIIIIQSSVYGVRSTSSSSCTSNPNDCLASYSRTSYCAGRQTCVFTYFKPNTTIVPDCGSKPADYFYVTYQCVPSKIEKNCKKLIYNMI